MPAYQQSQARSTQERRRDERIIRIELCAYELSRFSDSDKINLSEGRAITVNVSHGGLLLLLPQPVHESHIFEVTAPSIANEKKITKVVEVRWTRPLAVTGNRLHLAGIQFLMDIP